MIESKISHVTSVTPHSNINMRASLSSIAKAKNSDSDPSLPTEETSKDQLKKIESRQKINQQEILPGRESDPAMQALFGTNNKTSQKSTPYFTASNLYDATGNPQDKDIRQDNIGDCYFVATLAALADRQPQRIKNAIQYDEKTETFQVTMYKPCVKMGFPVNKLVGEAVKIPVTQSDILYNLQRRGGSTVDNNGGHQGPIWPAVIETAFAKMHDKNWSDGLQEGFDKISGGFPSVALFSLTGDAGKVIILNPSMIPFPGSALNNINSNHVYKAVSKALSNNQPTTLAVRKEFGDLLNKYFSKDAPQDGLRDFHVYEVKNIYKDAKGEIMISLRNPWATNEGVGEGHDNPSPIIDVELKKFVNLGMLGAGSINIGPAMK